MIQFVNVTKKYPRSINALESVTFEIQEGEFVFLIGPSGSGKTTVIRMLIREELPSEGKIYFDNDDITRYSRNDIYNLRRKIGVIFQDYKLIEDKTAFENVAFVMEAAGQSPKDIHDTVPYVLDIVGLADRQDAFPKELSGGEKQRVAIARALSNNPKLLIADEPTGNLDPEAAWDIVQILRKINNWGTTVLMSTHGLDIVDELSKRVIKLENGLLLTDEIQGKYVTNKDLEKKEFEKKLAKEEKPIVINSDIAEKNDEITETVESDDSEVDEEIEESDETSSEPALTQKPKPKLRISLISKKKEEGDSEKEDTKKEKKKDKKKKNKDNERESSDLNNLDLPKEIIDILFSSGFKDLESLINAGTEGVEDIELLTKEDIKNIRESIAKFIEQKL